MPCITPHVCRHTFYSKMAKTGMNPKTLQYIMGHSKAVRGVENTAKSSIYGGFSVMIKILFICHGTPVLLLCRALQSGAEHGIMCRENA